MLSPSVVLRWNCRSSKANSGHAGTAFTAGSLNGPFRAIILEISYERIIFVRCEHLLLRREAWNRIEMCSEFMNGTNVLYVNDVLWKMFFYSCFKKHTFY